MKFRVTLVLSLLMHLSLAAIFFRSPSRGGGSGETTYYVDLIQMPGGPGGGPGYPAATPAETGDAALVADASGSVKDLTVSESPKSSFRYPDAASRQKVEKESLISVVRKKPADDRSNQDKKPTQDRNTPGSSGITLGSGDPGGGTESGYGDGSGGGGGYFPYAYYVDMLRNRISSSWYGSLVTPGLRGRFLCRVGFRLDRDGGIRDLRLEKPSGSESLDLSALRAVENAAPFAALPDDFPDDYLIVHFEFEWNK